MSRRTAVANFKVRHAQHAGLWLDKYLPDHEAGTGQVFVANVARIPMPDTYNAFYKRWLKSLKSAGVKEEHMREAKVQGRLAVGLGGEAVLETAITLHRTYGVPYIPGSALKGLASSYAHKRLEADWRKGGEAHTIMFGDTTTAGYVTFFDALYVPCSGHKNGDTPQALWPDVITVHHPDYYGGKDSAPADWDSPTPVSFLSATGRYLIALQGDEAWVEKAFEILAMALAEEGVGAKTSSGYGRMIITGMEFGKEAMKEPVVTKSLTPDEATIERFRIRLDNMPDSKVAGEIHSVYQLWKAEDVSDEAKMVIAQAILERIDKAGRSKKSAKKAWYQELQAYVSG